VRGSELGYRGRVRLAVNRGKIGFFAPHSHELVEARHCHVATAGVQAALTTLRAAVSRESTDFSAFRGVEVREGSDGSISLFFQTDPAPRGPVHEGLRSWPTGRGVLAELAERFTVVTSWTEAREPRTWQRFEPAVSTFLWVPPGCFTQVNWPINRALVAAVLAGAQARGVRTFLDLYAGAGNFAFPLLQAGFSGVAVEDNRLATEGAARAATEQGHSPKVFLNLDSGVAVTQLAREGQRYDLVVIDPPRAGITFEPAQLVSLVGRHLALCSCNPVTLARDLRRLLALGFELEQLMPLEMFPQTYHLEVLAWLRAPAKP
jgi:23S rRNA (uracil1939-C5)-methyltransferase